DGFDDGSAIADAKGNFTLTDVQLKDGENLVTVRSENGEESIEAGLTIWVDEQAPIGELLTPVANMTINTDVGYVDIQWNDFGHSELDGQSVDVDDILLSGVSIDRF